MPNVGDERFPLPFLRRWTSKDIKRRLFTYQHNPYSPGPLPGDAKLKNLARHLQKYVNMAFRPKLTEFRKTILIRRQRASRGTASEFEDALIEWVDSRNAARWGAP